MKSETLTRYTNRFLVIVSLLHAVWMYFELKSYYRFYIDHLLFSIDLLMLLFLFIINIVVSIQNRNIIVFLVFVVCVVVPWNLPFSKTTPDETYFAEHKSEYEAVVELARQHKVEHGGGCQYAFLPPNGYEHLTIMDCIFVEHEPALVVEFTPKFSRRLFVYAETYEALQDYISCGGSDGSIGKKVDEKWYICHQDWN